jgi:hypothetical protein
MQYLWLFLFALAACGVWRMYHSLMKRQEEDSRFYRENIERLLKHAERSEIHIERSAVELERIAESLTQSRSE